MATNNVLAVECRTCPVRELHCDDCMVPVLLSLSEAANRPGTALDGEERAAVTRLVRAGLVDAETAARARATLDPRSHPQAPGQPGSRAVG